MEVYLIRHTSVNVPKGTCYGFTDVPLKPSFRREATAARLRLRGLRFDRVFTSPLSRAAKLAAFCGFPDAIRDARLKEMDMGEWEMQRFDNITDERLQLWYDDFLNQPTTGGESFRQLYARGRPLPSYEELRTLRTLRTLINRLERHHLHEQAMKRGEEL